MKNVESPFQNIVDVIAGMGPDVLDVQLEPLPRDAIVLGIPDDGIKMIGAQAFFNRQVISAGIGKAEREMQKEDPEISRLIGNLDAATKSLAVSSVLGGIFWEGVYATLPNGSRWSGDFRPCTGWNIAGPRDEVTLLSSETFPADKFIGNFFDRIVSICHGKVLYDAPQFNSYSGDGIIVGAIDIESVRQFHMFWLGSMRVLRQHDPYPSFKEEILAFKGKSFDSYAAWKHVGRRLLDMSRLLQKLSALGVADCIDNDKILKIHPEGGLIKMSFKINSNWDIVALPVGT